MNDIHSEDMMGRKIWKWVIFRDPNKLTMPILGVVYHLMSNTLCRPPAYSYSRDMIGALRFKMVT